MDTSALGYLDKSFDAHNNLQDPWNNVDFDCGGEVLKGLHSTTHDTELVHLAHQLICLRNVLALLSDNTTPMDEILASFVHLIPEAWQFPDITCTRLLLGQEVFTSVNYKSTEWFLDSKIIISDIPVGSLAVYYLEERPKLFEGPFLKQERDMIDTLTTELARFIERRELLESEERQHRELVLYSSLLRHDLKNDLGIILANIDLARLILKDIDQEVEEIMCSTEVVCSRMIELLNSFQRSADTVDQNLYQLIIKVSRNAQEIHNGLNVDIKPQEKSDCFLVPKSNLLPVVFENLLRNAALHAGDSCSVMIELKRRSGFVIIRISDDGPGVSEVVRATLFQKGVSTRGGGLGLYLSRQVIETMGGSIELVSSKSGEGAVFEIKLPMGMILEKREKYD